MGMAVLKLPPGAITSIVLLTSARISSSVAPGRSSTPECQILRSVRFIPNSFDSGYIVAVLKRLDRIDAISTR